MAYEKQTWEDRQVENPLTFMQQTNLDGSITLTPHPGSVKSEGSKMSASKFNHMEDGIFDVAQAIEDLKTQLQGTVLFESDGETGDITLSEDVSQYNRITIYFGKQSQVEQRNIRSSITIDSPDGKTADLVLYYEATTNFYQLINANVTISGNTLSKVAYMSINYFHSGNVADASTTDNTIRIYKVIGYKDIQ